MPNDGGQAKTPAAGNKAVEITIVANFPSPWANEADEIVAIKKGFAGQHAWAPSTPDFDQVYRSEIPKGAIPVCNNVGDFLGQLQDPGPGKVGRVNLLTHGNDNVFALGGRNTTAGDTFFRGDTPSDKVFNDVEPLKSVGLTRALMDLFNSTEKGLRATFRECFHPSAHLVVYACGEGSTTGVAELSPKKLLLRAIASCWNIKASGFVDAIEYKPVLNAAETKVVSRNQIRYENQKDLKKRTGPFITKWRSQLTPDLVVEKPQAPAP